MPEVGYGTFPTRNALSKWALSPPDRPLRMALDLNALGAHRIAVPPPRERGSRVAQTPAATASEGITYAKPVQIENGP